MDLTLLSLLLASSAIILVSLSGAIFTAKHLNEWVESRMQYLIAFASGVFTVVAYNLIFEAFEFSESKILVLISIITGFLFFLFLEKLYPEVHCHHSDDKCLVSNSKRSANKILIGDAFHNLGDGLLLAPIFVIDIRLGFVATIGILVHEIVQELSEFFVLKAAGYTNREALWRNFLVSTTILVGAVAGFYLSSFSSLIGPLIGLAAGAFIYILVIDLIPESIKNSHREKKYLNYLAWALVGVLIILATNSF